MSQSNYSGQDPYDWWSSYQGVRIGTNTTNVKLDAWEFSGCVAGVYDTLVVMAEGSKHK